jgi:hypothetical protein
LALKGDPPVVVIGELKLTFNLELVLQGVDRAAACDEVWPAALPDARRPGTTSLGLGQRQDWDTAVPRRRYA